MENEWIAESQWIAESLIDVLLFFFGLVLFLLHGSGSFS